ncbi:MAG: YbjN domain-containing protein [Rhodospirillaceae bacterium]|nr:YbjN domain-containing protein [Rhodospirillaceae bacterium]
MQSDTARRQSVSAPNPVEAIEELIAEKDWIFDRRCDTEIAVEAPGTWCDYGMFFAWSEDLSALHFSCALDMRVQPKLMGQIYELIAKLNERLWLGHFAVWVEEGIPMFRHTLRFKDQVDTEAIADLMDLAVSECERYYPAFQFVIWGGRTAEDAITSSLLDTVGQA